MLHISQPCAKAFGSVIIIILKYKVINSYLDKILRSVLLIRLSDFLHPTTAVS